LVQPWRHPLRLSYVFLRCPACLSYFFLEALFLFTRRPSSGALERPLFPKTSSSFCPQLPQVSLPPSFLFLFLVFPLSLNSPAPFPASTHLVLAASLLFFRPSPSESHSGTPLPRTAFGSLNRLVLPFQSSHGKTSFRIASPTFFHLARRPPSLLHAMRRVLRAFRPTKVC